MTMPITPPFVFAWWLIGLVACIAFAMGSQIGFGKSRALREALLWGGCLLAGTGTDYVLAALNTHSMA